MRLLVAIPCLNEAVTIGNVISSIPKSIQGISEITVLVVDDGSSDETVDIAIAHHAKVIRHHVNRGVGMAFHSAINYAVDNNFDVMVNIDGDRQFDPADIPKLVIPILNKQADMVTASRFANRDLRPDMPPVKLVGNYMMSFLISKLCGQKFADVSCGFRAYSREALLQINLHGLFTYTQETFLDMVSKKLRIVEAPISVTYFKDRQSRVARSIPRYALNTAAIILRIYRDYFPLKFFMAIAVMFMLPALVLGAIFFGHYFITGMFRGYLYLGFLSGFFATIGLVFALVAIVVDMLDRIRVNQERILYLLKKKRLP
jgi:glycosyltransferase involved in cell wall biosynthesis